MNQPTLTFLCEVDSHSLADVLRPPVVARLREMNARVALGMPQDDDYYRDAAKLLASSGIGLTAWLLLPAREGIYFSFENYPAARERCASFLDWTDRNSLQWDAVAFDFEPLCGVSRALGSWAAATRFVRQSARRLRNSETTSRAAEVYARLADGVKARSLLLEAYEFPFVMDERRAGTSGLRRLAGTPTARADIETLMLYTTFAPALGPTLLEEYAMAAQSVAVGVTGAPAHHRRLSWSELARDLCLAARHCSSISVHSLEGCIEQGFLDRIQSLDWTEDVRTTGAARLAVRAGRACLRAVLGAGSVATKRA